MKGDHEHGIRGEESTPISVYIPTSMIMNANIPRI